MTLTVAPEYAIAHATVADEEHGCEEYQAADGAWLTLEEETDQIENDEHDVGLHEGWIRWLRDQEHGDQTL